MSEKEDLRKKGEKVAGEFEPFNPAAEKAGGKKDILIFVGAVVMVVVGSLGTILMLLPTHIALELGASLWILLFILPFFTSYLIIYYYAKSMAKAFAIGTIAGVITILVSVIIALQGFSQAMR